MRRRLTIPAVAILCTVAFAIAVVIVETGGGGSARAEALTARVRLALEQDYYRKLPRQVLAQRTVPDLIAALHDPYTEYLDPASYRLVRSATGSHYSGVGLTLWPVAEGLGVAAVPAGPARRAGLRAGDVVLSIDGAPAAALGFVEALGRVLGPPGTTVTLRVRRGAARWTVRLMREMLPAPPVQYRLIAAAAHRVAYLRLPAFRSGVTSATASVLRRLERNGASAVVLDLRGNPGGLLDQAVSLSSLFLQRGTIVKIEGAHLPLVVYRARGGAEEPNLPLAVLVDRWSASAAEVVAAALQDNDRAVLVGESTFGKGLVQTVRPLPDGGALKLKTGRYLTPIGTDISGVGVRPDVIAPDNPRTPRDEGLQTAVDVLTNR
ncbi:MAG TPA: S41 family peptidase [Gaiellaceae bacterium]